MKLRKLKIRRKKRTRAKVNEITSKTVKCLLMGSAPELIADLQQNNSKDLIRNEVDIEIGTTRYLFWTLPDQSVMKRPFLKQYLSYHKCGIIFFIVNQDKIEVKVILYADDIHF